MNKKLIEFILAELDFRGVDTTDLDDKKAADFLYAVNIFKARVAKIEEDTEEDLNRDYPPLKIGNLEYPAGAALRKVDNVAFREICRGLEDEILRDFEKVLIKFF